MSLSPDSITTRLRAAGCVFAEDETALILEAAHTPNEIIGMVEQRAAGAPLEYILGWAQFCGVRVIIEPGVFVPRRRTEALVLEASALVQPGMAVVDLCCGSGAVGAILLARHRDITLFAADIDSAAVHCARRNVDSASSVFQGDLFSALPATLHARVDIVVANAPYVPTDAIATMPPEARLHENRIALDGGPDGLDLHRRITADVSKWLTSGGFLLVETSRRQAQATAGILHEAGLSTRIAVNDQLESTVVIGQRA